MGQISPFCGNVVPVFFSLVRAGSYFSCFAHIFLAMGNKQKLAHAVAIHV